MDPENRAKRCLACGEPALENKATCGRVECTRQLAAELVRDHPNPVDKFLADIQGLEALRDLLAKIDWARREGPPEVLASAARAYTHVLTNPQDLLRIVVEAITAKQAARDLARALAISEAQADMVGSVVALLNRCIKSLGAHDIEGVRTALMETLPRLQEMLDDIRGTKPGGAPSA